MGGRRLGVVAKATATAAVCSVLLSCILLISPATGGDECLFKGESSLCGACVQTGCQDRVNACCADADCAGALADLESCTTEHGAACATLQGGTVTGDTATALATCVAASCRGECQPFSGKSTSSCSEPAFGDGSVCTCELSDQPNDFVCSPKDYPGTICCAPNGWPAEGIQCSCLALGCNPTSDGCFCDLVNYAPMEQACSASHCCAQQDSCTCRAGPCFEFETPVDRCDITAVTCGTGQQQVTSCSLMGT